MCPFVALIFVIIDFCFSFLFACEAKRVQYSLKVEAKEERKKSIVNEKTSLESAQP